MQDSRRRLSELRTPILLALLALVAWIPPIQGAGFSFDDREVLVGNPVVEGNLPWTSAFDRDYWHHRGDAGHYRPLATLSLRVDRALHGMSAPGFRYTNALLHASVVLLTALFWVRRRGKSAPQTVFFGLAIFACHPLLADAVAWISGRTSMLSSLGGLIGLHVALFAERSPEASVARGALALLGAGLATFLALLCKEDGYVFGLFTIWAVSKDRQTLIASLSGAAAGLIFYLLLRHMALGAALPSAPHAPLAAADLMHRLQVGGLALLEGLRLAAVPWAYPPQYNAGSLLPGVAAGLARTFLGIAAWVLIWVALLRPCFLFGRQWLTGSSREPNAASTSAFFMALSMLPLMQIVPAGEVFAPRWAYLPLLFAVPLTSAFFPDLRKVTWRPAVRSSLVLPLFVLLSWQRAAVYESRASFRQAVLQHRPGDAPSWNDLGIAFWEEDKKKQAIAAWQRAALLDESYSRPHTNLGNAAMQRGEIQEALRHYRDAIQRGSKQPLAYLNLSNALRQDSQGEASLQAAMRAVELAPGMNAAHRAVGRALLVSGDPRGAVQAFDRALALNPGDDLAAKLKSSAEREMLSSSPR